MIITVSMTIILLLVFTVNSILSMILIQFKDVMTKYGSVEYYGIVHVDPRCN